MRLWLIAALGALSAACGSTPPSGPSTPPPLQLTTPAAARETCEGVGYAAPAAELPETTAVKLYGFLLKCDARRALAAGQDSDGMLIFPPIPEGGKNQHDGQESDGSVQLPAKGAER